MKTSELLIKAKKLLHSPRDNPAACTHYVCTAIEYAAQRAEPRYRRAAHLTASRLKYRISESIGGDRSSVISWLYEHHPTVHSDIMRRGKQQEYRHAWVDSLIAEYQAKGD